MLHLLQHPDTAVGQIVMNSAVLTHGLKALTQTRLARHAGNIQSCGKKIVVFKMMNMLKADSPHGNHAAESFEDIRILYFVIRQIATGTYLIDTRYTHKLPNARQPGIDDGMMGSSVTPILSKGQNLIVRK
jgi:hypothetical protein